MTFRSLGQFVSQHGKSVLTCWGLALIVCLATAPSWDDVVQDGEFIYLPPSAPSQRGEAVYREAFRYDLLGSTAVIVVRRVGRAEGLLKQDRHFVEHILKPAILEIAEDAGGLSETTPSANAEKPDRPRSIIRAVRTTEDRVIGRLLTSDEDHPQSTLVLVEFTTQFLNRENWPILQKIETLIAQEGKLIHEPENLFTQKKIPPGLELSLSGPATVGRDLRRNAEYSTSAIVQWTFLIGIAGLLLFYRAPLLVVAQLINATVSVAVTMAILAHLARWNFVTLFAGLENYAIAVLAGLSVMLGMLFVSRENETRFRTPTLEDATRESIRSAGPILASGGVIFLLGWGMLAFAQFGKFQQLGGTLLIGAVCVMVSTLTLLPALLSLCGRWALWPNLRTERISADRTWSLPRDPWSRFAVRSGSPGLWKRVWRSIEARPQSVLIAGLLGMVPFLLVALIFHGHLTYGLLSQLPDAKPSVKGAMIIQEQFPAGSTGPVTLLVKHPEWDFSRLEGQEVIRELSDILEREKDTFRIADVRSVTYPLGIDQKEVGMDLVTRRMYRYRRAVEYYVGDNSPEAHHATKLEIVFDDDPFSRQSIDQFEKLRQELPHLLPDSLEDAEWHLLGAPASLRDLKTVTDGDRLLIQVAVLLSVFVCLMLLFRDWSHSLVLVALGGFNYLAALGATFAAFWLVSPRAFEGLDWKVIPFLFTILFVFGTASYGILLARIREEQHHHGPVDGLRLVLERKGNLLLGSGLIVGGLFASLLGGSLVSLKQLGFGLACGALVDALLIRPVLIPACLLLLLRESTEPEPAFSSESLATTVPTPQKSLKLTVPPDSDA